MWCVVWGGVCTDFICMQMVEGCTSWPSHMLCSSNGSKSGVVSEAYKLLPALLCACKSVVT